MSLQTLERMDVNQPWHPQVWWNAPLIHIEGAHWSQPEYRYRILFDVALMYDEQQFIQYMEEQDQIEKFADCLLVKDPHHMIYFNGDFVDILMYLRLTEGTRVLASIYGIESLDENPNGIML